MMKNVRKIIGLVVAFFIISYPGVIQAKPVYVIECAEGDTECQENISNIDEVESEENDVLSVEKNKSLFLSVIQTFFALLLVLALIYILVKFLSKRNSSFSQVKALENIGGIPIGQNKSIQLVRVGQRVYMLGVGDTVELLEEITDPNLIDELIHNNHEDTNQVTDLFALFNKFKQKNKREDKSRPESEEFKNMYTTELTKLKQTRNQIKQQQDQKEDLYE